MKKLITIFSAIAFAAATVGCANGVEIADPPPDDGDGPDPTEAGGGGDDEGGDGSDDK